MDTIQKSTLIVTCSIIGVILISCVVLFATVTSMSLPQKPNLIDSKVSTEQDCKAKEITNYKELTNSLMQQKTSLFDLIVIKTLLPLLTSLIAGVFTYIIAKSGMTTLSNYYLERARLSEQFKQDNK